MARELPKMYQNKINKPINSIQKVYSSINESEDRHTSNRYSSISIDKKIDNIFNSADSVYKADVKIVTDNDEVMSRRIVARNKNNLITIDNEFIPISSIRDIYK